MPELRATLTQQALDRIDSLCEFLGKTRRAEALEFAINSLWLKLAQPSAWPDKQKKAAAIITQQRNLIGFPMRSHEIIKIEENAKSVTVYTCLSAEPYIIRREDWLS